jgi:MFS-type transporter involved in bile tolerance (Atg22 family)
MKKLCRINKESKVNIIVICLTFVLPAILLCIIWGYLRGDMSVKVLSTIICIVYIKVGIWLFGKDRNDNSNTLHKNRNRAP